ncbi:MAG: hypothetical protein JW837_03345 [Sedimentisphaerales bacterium]|nr:hypothetical protein [Sedimentisphaerales bacterium]
MEKKMLTTVSILTVFIISGHVQANALSIYEIQYTIDPNGMSPQDGNIIDCTGGIVVHKTQGSRPRLAIQDPNDPKGWGAIQVKGWTSDVFDGIAIGDRISLNNVLVEDYKGTTFLQYQSENNSNLTIVSTNNPLPKPLVVTIDEISAPSESFDAWIVPDHAAEKYESMIIKVVNVNISDIGYGKAFDNYVLTSNTDPNMICWASDYMNTDKEKGLIYHPIAEIGQNLCGVTGILEQYTGDSEGIFYDYYQLLTTNTKAFTIEQIADLDGDCDVDCDDFTIFIEHWLEGK